MLSDKKLLKLARENKITLTLLAKVSDLSTSHLYQVSCGKKNLSKEKREKIEKFLRSLNLFSNIDVWKAEQKNIKIINAETSPLYYNMKIPNLLDEQSFLLKNEVSFKLYPYLFMNQVQSVNQPVLSYILSEEDFCSKCRCSYEDYKEAFNELINQGYLSFNKEQEEYAEYNFLYRKGVR